MRRAARRPVETVEFRDGDRAAVLARMEGLQAAGQGWMNLQPGIHPEDEPPPPSGLSVLFGTPSFPVPVGTWIPGHPGWRAQPPDTLGVQHGTGPKVVRRLAAAGVALPEGWRWTQDHPRRGLVVELPPGTPPVAVLDWLLRAMSKLAALELTGQWRAEFHGLGH